MRTVGLENLGNTCYLNATLQCLAHGKSFAKLFEPGGRMGRAIKRWLSLESRAATATYSPEDIVALSHKLFPNFASYSQQDAHEYLRFLLNALAEEGGEGVELFKGKLESTVVCGGCGSLSAVVEDFLDLSLSIGGDEEIVGLISNFYSRIRNATIGEKPTTLVNCINAFFQEERLTGAERYFCEKCKKRTEGRKTLRLLKTPEMLCLHLKRFRYEGNGWLGGSKNGRPVEFPVDECLDLSKFIKKTASDLEFSSQSHKYKLFAVLQHYGSMGGGHYVAFCKDDEWRLFDDSRVTKVSTKRVTASEGYLLFYSKMRSENVERDCFLANRRSAVLSADILTKHVPTSWLNRLNTLSAPGEISLPKHLICPHMRVGRLEKDDLFIVLPEELVNDLASKYGVCEELVNFWKSGENEKCGKCCDYIIADNKRRVLELALVTEHDSREVNDGNSWYLVDQDWIIKWKRYIDAQPSETLAQVIALKCGPIDNSKLSKRAAVERLKVGKDFSAINEVVWNLFMHFHGGGPPIKRHDFHEIDTSSNEQPSAVKLPDQLGSASSWRFSWKFIDECQADEEKWSQ